MNILLVSGLKSLTLFFSSVYGSGTYDGSTYDGQATSSSSSGGILTNTGFDLTLIITIAFVIALTAVIVRIWKKPNHNTSLTK